MMSVRQYPLVLHTLQLFMLITCRHSVKCTSIGQRASKTLDMALKHPMSSSFVIKLPAHKAQRCAAVSMCQQEANLINHQIHDDSIEAGLSA